MSWLDRLRPRGFTVGDAAILPYRKGYNPGERVVSNQIYFPHTGGICPFADSAVISQCNHMGSQANLMLQQNNLGTPWSKKLVSAWACRDWEIMALALEMRPGASPHIGLCWNGNCNGKTCVCVSCKLRWHNCDRSSHKCMMQSYYSIELLEETPTMFGCCSRLPNNARVRSPSWSYDLIYDVVRAWPDSYQERNVWNAAPAWTL
jgi:hypothetical protein